MTRPAPLNLNLTLTLSALALAACGETTAPTEVGTAGDQSLAITSFDLPSNTWTAIGLAAPERVWQYGVAAGAVNNNAAGQSIVYVLGGRYNQMPSDPPATTILAYDLAMDRWTTKAARFTGGATNGAGTIGNKLYISGGWDFTGGPEHWIDVSARLFAYDVARDRVIRKADMPEPTGEGVTGVINGKLYVLAGKCFQQFCRNFYRYDPATNAWTTLPSAPNSHRNGAGVVLDGKFYVAGGGTSPFRSFDV
jgi:Kelch motif protein